MRKTKKKICICGGGATGIVAALFFKNKNFDVTLIEKSNAVGGILKPNKSNIYQLDQVFWMPNYTGIKEMDNFLDKIFIKKKFNKFWYKKKDIAGSIINKKFNPNSCFPDIKTFSKKLQKDVSKQVLNNRNNLNDTKNFRINLDVYFKERFGSIAQNEIFKKISKKFWRLDPRMISSAALKIIHLNRINLFSEKRSLIFKKNLKLDNIVAYPNQFKIPLKFLRNKTASIYPKKYGLFNFLDHFLPLLKKNISLYLNSEISKIFLKNKKINLEVNNKNLVFDYVLWCGPNKEIYQLIAKNKVDLVHRPIKHLTVYALVNKKVYDGGIYWCWDFDIKNPIVRVSFPNNYSSKNNFKNKKLVMFEMHEDNKIKNIENYLKNYLLERKIIKKKNIFELIPDSTFYRYFFIPSVENIKIENQIIDTLKKKLPSNIFLCSAQISNFKFYFDDLLKLVYESYKDIKKNEV